MFELGLEDFSNVKTLGTVVFCKIDVSMCRDAINRLTSFTC